MVTLEHVSKFIISDVSLHIPEGIIVGLVGASGAGKTTLLRLICGLLQCEQGRVRTLFEDPVKNRSRIAKDIRAFFSGTPVFQEDGAIFLELQRLCVLYGMDQEEFQYTYKMLARELQFQAYEHTEIRQLSLGQKRRGELATVLLGAPRLILLDDPTSGLDEQAKKNFWGLLKKRKEEGTTVVISSHNPIEEERLCDRLILLNKGHLLYYGEPERLKQKYMPVYEMEFVFKGPAPDAEDLPLIKYCLENDRMRLRYNTNIISTAEIISHFMRQSDIEKLCIQQPRLEDCVTGED